MSLVAALPVSDRGFGPFLDELYAAALEPALFQQALASFGSAFLADESRFLICDRHAAGAERAHFVEFGEAASGNTTLDRRQSDELLGALGTRDVIGGAAVSAGTLGNVGWPNDKWTLGGLHYIALSVPVDERWIVALVAVRRHAAFSDHDQGTARSLLSDVKRALAFHWKATRSKGFAVGDRLFEARDIAIIVTRQRVVEHTNEAAARLLEREGLLRLAGRNLRFEDVRVAAAFDELSKPCGRAKAASRSLAFIVAEGKGESWLVQLSRHQTPSVSPLLAETSNNSLVVIALTPLSAASGARGALIDGFVDLTVTERAVLSAFVDGKDIACIAGEMRRSVETVRWHVRNLFAKLGVNSQADLTRLGSLLLPI
jgi:DNA-binding CsgD family transcriptional regulator